MRLIRVFPRRTKATPVDGLAYVGVPDMFAEADAVHISVSFTWDLPLAERLAKSWERVAPVTIGGPATGERSGDFVPGRYLKAGYTITSRGCPNHCWFCSVWRREGVTRELPIHDGWNLLDDNLIACSRPHIEAVFAMLAKQKRRVQFTGGIEAARLEPWHVDLFAGLSPKPTIFFAWDTPDDYEPLRDAAIAMLNSGFTAASHNLRCYVLVGFPTDTMDAADRRLTQCVKLGLTPMAMLHRDQSGQTNPEWRAFQRRWARPAIIHAKVH